MPELAPVMRMVLPARRWAIEEDILVGGWRRRNAVWGRRRRERRGMQRGGGEVAYVYCIYVHGLSDGWVGGVLTSHDGGGGGAG